MQGRYDCRLCIGTVTLSVQQQGRSRSMDCTSTGPRLQATAPNGPGMWTWARANKRAHCRYRRAALSVVAHPAAAHATCPTALRQHCYTSDARARGCPGYYAHAATILAFGLTLQIAKGVTVATPEHTNSGGHGCLVVRAPDASFTLQIAEYLVRAA